MSVPRSRAFIVIDLDNFPGSAADLASLVEDSLLPHDVTVYATLDDMLHDKAAGVDMFDRTELPIRRPAHH